MATFYPHYIGAIKRTLGLISALSSCGTKGQLRTTLEEVRSALDRTAEELIDDSRDQFL
jgi:hypothetical protein